MKRDGERKRVITFGHCLEIRLENFVLSHIHYSLQITYYEGELSVYMYCNTWSYWKFNINYLVFYWGLLSQGQ